MREQDQICECRRL